ncbi:MAG: helix-turn-helix transcriptional regulator [Xanthobacteraceae bacterium]|nr:helix-turn-helix transcriptional regulator [Xanthobacteraceae bacterium]
MSDIDALVRGAAIGITLVLEAAFLRSRRSKSQTIIGLLYAAGVIGYILWHDPARADWPRLLNPIIGILALSCPFFFWALARNIFEDDFQIRGAHWALLATIIVAGVAQSVLPGIRFPWLPTALRTVFRVLSLGLVLHVFWLVFTGGRVDLVEARARLRLGFLVIAGTGCAVVLLTALFYGPATGKPPIVRLGEALALLAITLTFAVVLLRVHPDFLPPEPATEGATAGAGDPASPAPFDPDAAALQRLDALMRRDGVWRETGLTIGTLAERAAVPEYRLRRLINGRLGFRNFTAYLNEYRLAAAAARLGDPKEIRIPVLTIALDLGWGSIGPFNRAFRARFGMTPTEYRQHKLGAATTSLPGSPNS